MCLHNQELIVHKKYFYTQVFFSFTQKYWLYESKKRCRLHIRYSFIWWIWDMLLVIIYRKITVLCAMNNERCSLHLVRYNCSTNPSLKSKWHIAHLLPSVPSTSNSNYCTHATMQPNIYFVCTYSLILQGQLSARTHSLETLGLQNHCSLRPMVNPWHAHFPVSQLLSSCFLLPLQTRVSFPFIACYFVLTPSGTCFNESGYLPLFSSKYLLTFMIYHHNKLCFYTAVCYSFFWLWLKIYNCYSFDTCHTNFSLLL